jgi:hypothetical protein
MARQQFSRDKDIHAPAGIDEIEQSRVLSKAATQYSGFSELTAIPADMPPPGHGFVSAGTINAEISDRLYRVYVRPLAHSGPGPQGTRTNSLVVDHGTMAVTQHKPKKVSQSSHAKEHDNWGDGRKKPNSKILKPQEGLKYGTEISGELIKIIGKLKKVIADPSSTEEQIIENVRIGLIAQRGVPDGNLLLGALQKQIADGLEKAQSMRSSAFEKLVSKEERSSGSISEETFKKESEKLLSGERQLQLLGIDSGGPKTMELVGKALQLMTKRQITKTKKLLGQSGQARGAALDPRLTTAVQNFLGMYRQCQLLGIDVPEAAEFFSEVMRITAPQ